MTKQLKKFRGFRVNVLATIMVAVSASFAQSQSLWQVTPYNVTAWIAIETNPELPREWLETLPKAIQLQSEVALGALWRTTATAAPESFRDAAIEGRLPDPYALLTSNDSLKEADKLFVIALLAADGGFRLEVRELDTATRVWSGTQSIVCFDPADVPRQAFRLMNHAFAPLAQIVRVEETAVTAEVRAGALSMPEGAARSWNNPTRVRPGDFLLPYIRKTDRDGKVKEKGVSEVKYTVLLTESVDAKGTLACEAHSGYRQAFKTRRSSRTQQLALVGRNTGRTTTLRAHERSDETANLVGYDVYAREPGSEKSSFVGRTDWKGELVIPVGSTPVRILFIKSGNRVLAKLPVVPGLQGRIDVALRNDDARLEAEGFLLGVQESLVDLVARREILSIRIRGMIEKGRYDDAEPLLSELRRLPNREDFENLVTNRKQLLSTGDDQVQVKIDKLFNDTRELFTKFLDPHRVQELQEQLRTARENGPPVSAEEEVADDAANSDEPE